MQKIDGLSFVEAVERLAGRSGIELRYEQGGYVPGQEQSQRRRLIEAHRAAAEFYAERLAAAGAEPGARFPDRRGFRSSDAERFGVGFSPDVLGRPDQAPARPRLHRGELITAGLARDGSRGPLAGSAGG